MIYEYLCTPCNRTFDVVKSVKDFNREELCECGGVATRQFTPNVNALPRVSGLTYEAQYNPAFGKVIKNKREERYEAEKRGMVQVGNDFGSGEKMQKHFDQVKQEKLDKAYDDI